MLKSTNPTRTRFLRIGIIESVPWSYRTEDGSGWTGLCIDLINTLSDQMNFNYSLVPSFDEDIDQKDLVRKQGIIFDLVSMKTDMVVAPVPMKAGKEEIIDYITPYFDNSGISVVIRKPLRDSSFFKFMTVLSLDVWLSTISAVFITALAHWLIEKFAFENKRNGKKGTLKESLWFAITTFSSQGSANIPSALSHRILIAAYWVFVLVMMTTFTANMAAFLTVERLQTPISSIWELVRQTRIKYTVVENSHTHAYFRNMKMAEDTLFGIWRDLALSQTAENESNYRTWDYPIREEYRHALLMIERNNPVPNASIGFEKVLDNEKGEFALIHDTAEVRYRTYQDCRFAEIGEIFSERPYSVTVPKNSSLRQELMIKILDLHEERYFESVSAKYWNLSNLVSCNDDDDNQSVALESLGGVFISTVCGTIIALLMLMVEISQERRRKKNKKRHLKAGVPKHPQTTYHLRANYLKKILKV